MPVGVPVLGTTNVTAGSSPSIASSPDYIALLNSLNRQGQAASLAQRIPGGPGLEGQSSANISQELAGQLPQDVLNLIQQQGAERGVMTGGGAESPNTEAAVLAAIGRNSLQQQQQGQQDLTAALARNPQAPLVNLNNMLLGPYEAGQLNLGGTRNMLGALSQLQPTPYTGPGATQPVAPVIPTTEPGLDWWNNIPGFAGVNPTQPDTSQMSDQEFQAWQDYVMSGGQEPGTTIASSTLPTQPAGTVYNPATDQTTFDPFAQYGLGSFLDTGATDVGLGG